MRLARALTCSLALLCLAATADARRHRKQKTLSPGHTPRHTPRHSRSSLLFPRLERGDKAKAQEAPTPNPKLDEKKQETKGIFISESEIEVLKRAKEIISRIEEATTVGSIGTAQAPTFKKKDKKIKARKGKNSFLDYIAKK